MGGMQQKEESERAYLEVKEERVWRKVQLAKLREYLVVEACKQTFGRMVFVRSRR